MSKELIEKLREAADTALGNMPALLWKAADALEAKAAPVGEPTSGMVLAAIQAFRLDISPTEAMYHALKAALQAGATYQRAQQPQSAEAVNRAHVMDALLLWNRRHEIPPIKIGYEYGVADAVLDLVATPQPSAGVVMPERKRRPYGFTHMPSHYEGWNACLDEFARLNGKEVGRG